MIFGPDSDWIAAPPPGYRIVSFVGGTMAGTDRIVREPVEPGDRYSRFVPVPEVYEFDGHVFVLLPEDGTA